MRLVHGDPTYYGAVYTSKGVKNGPVCADGFDENDASKNANWIRIYNCYQYMLWDFAEHWIDPPQQLVWMECHIILCARDMGFNSNYVISKMV